MAEAGCIKDGSNFGTATIVSGTSISVKNGSATAGFIEFFEDTDDGNNKVTLQSQALAGDITVNLPTAAGTLALTTGSGDLSTTGTITG